MVSKTKVRSTLKFGMAVLATAGFANAAAAQGLEWGSFKDNGCLGQSDIRSYSSVLWNIPNGDDWMATCLKTPARVTLRDGSTVTFPEPTTCTKSSASEALGVASLIVGVPGLKYPPAGAVSLVLGAGAYALDKGDLGALNVWGLFNVRDPSCRGYKEKGHIQNLTMRRPAKFLEGLRVSMVEQSVVRNTQGEGQTRVCFRNYSRSRIKVTHNAQGIGTFNRIGTLGSEECATFRSNLRVAFTLHQDDQVVQSSKPMTMSLSAFSGDKVTFAWKD